MGNACETRYELSVDVTQTEKRMEFAFHCSGFSFLKEVMCSLCTSSIYGRMTCQRYSTFSMNNVHFFILRVTLGSVILVRSSFTIQMWSSTKFEEMITLSMYTRQVFHLNLVKTMYSSRWYVGGAFVRHEIHFYLLVRACVTEKRCFMTVLRCDPDFATAIVGVQGRKYLRVAQKCD